MIPEAPGEVAVVEGDARLRALIDGLQGQDWVAVDTEFVRERTYYPQLCLIQLAAPGVLACVDPLALEDLSPLRELFANEAMTKVFHAAGQDLEILLQETGVVPAPVFDTQVAATLLGHTDQIGYARLVEARLGRKLDKAHARTDWSRRPLRPEEIDYAADDVRYLAELYPPLREELADRGRLDWLLPEFESMTDPARYRPDPAQAWRRVKGLRKLRPKQQHALARLAAWREAEAMRQDRPRGWILKDDVLTDIARRRPDSPEALGRIRGMPEATIRRHGDDLLDLLDTRDDDAGQALAEPGARLAPEQLPLVDLLMAGLRARAAAVDISSGALAGRGELERMAAGERDLPLLKGWRRAAAGEALLDLLEGRMLLRSDGQGVVLEQVAC